MNDIYNIMVKQNRNLSPSDNVLKLALDREISNSSAEGIPVIGTFIPKYSGTVRIKCSLRANNGLHEQTRGIKISSISTVIAEVKPTTSGSYSNVYMDIPVIKDVLYTLSMDKAYMTYGTSCNYCAVCGKIVSAGDTIIE